MKDARDTILWRVLNLDPAVWRGVVTAVFVLATAIGIKVAPQIPDAALLVILAVLPILQGMSTRKAVTPNAKVAVVVPDPIRDPNIVAPGEAVVNATDEAIIEAARGSA